MADRRNRESDQRYGPKRIAARVYDYCENGGRKPAELRTAEYVNKFGTQAIFGRSLYLHEIKEMIIAENVQDAYIGRKLSGDWAKWAEENPGLAEILSRAAKHVEC